jgi:hypothetical protein
MTSKRSSARTGTSRRIQAVVPAAVLALAAVILAVVGVIAMAARVGSPGQPVITGTVTGTVATVNGDGTALCLTVGGSQDNLCYGVWLLRGESMPAVSDTVTGWVVRVPRGSGEVEQLIIKPRGSFAPGAGVGS